jgi:hypothetical protein
MSLTALDPALGWLNAPVHVHELSGHPVLLHFWSLHSEHSLEQLPDVLALLPRFEQQGLRAVGIHVPLLGEDLDTRYLEERVRNLGVEMPVAVDDAGAAHSITVAHGVHEVPTFQIYDRQGLLIESLTGQDVLAALPGALERALATPASEGAAAP